MGRKKRDKIREKDITGLKYFDKLAPLLERLHDDAYGRDKAGNRQLHFDQYCMLILLYLFNPIITSLRGVQQAENEKGISPIKPESDPHNWTYPLFLLQLTPMLLSLVFVLATS